MNKILHILKKIWLLNFLRRIFNASKYYNKKYIEIIRWGLHSREYTNYTYELSAENIRYLANTIAVVTGTNFNTVMDYITEAENDSELKESLLRTTQQSSLRKYADLEIRFGRRLGWYAFARIMKPGVIIETGVDKGLGSTLLCAALLRNKKEGYEGHYFGTDLNPEAGYLLAGKYKDVGEILYGDSIESLKKLKKPIDLFINDSDHSADYEYREYETISPLLHEKSILLGDNAHCTDKLAIFSNKNNRRFLFYKEEPKNHWYPGAGIGISYK